MKANQALATKIGLMVAGVVATSGVAMANPITDALNSIFPPGVPMCLFNGPGCKGSVFQNIANTLIFIVGAASVIMLIIGGLRYVLSSGNPSAVEGAKNTILYAIIGVIVALLAFAAVGFVATRIGG